MTRQIPLSNSDKISVVSEEDYQKVSEHTWRWKSTKGGKHYVATSIREGKKVRTVYLHRFIMSPEKDEDVDHKDSDVLNNTRENLRCRNYYEHRTKAVDEHKMKVDQTEDIPFIDDGIPI